MSLKEIKTLQSQDINSPLLRKYFQRVICISGDSCSEAAFQVDPVGKARKLAQLLGCRGNTDQEVLGKWVVLSTLKQFETVITNYCSKKNRPVDLHSHILQFLNLILNFLSTSKIYI